MSPRPIALLTDFGLRDGYVGAMKGEILRRAPEAAILDLSHAIPPGAVAAGVFMLDGLIDSLPETTICCCVVDPGVGSTRRAICGRIGSWGFSGPDNGLATPLLERAAGADVALHEIESPEFRSTRSSTTFHGRDRFAPAAARLAMGLPAEAAGPLIGDPVRCPIPQPERTDAPPNAAPTDQAFVARVMWVDRFGNLVTNLRRADWAERFGAAGAFDLSVGRLRTQRLVRTFSDVPEAEPLTYWGSTGWLEIAVRLGSAAERAGAGLDDTVRVLLRGAPPKRI